MPITINGSNSLENLALQMSGELKKQQNHVFQPQYIVTQTEGMKNWLKIKLAANLGIVANCKFLKPNDLISEIYYKLGSANRQPLPAGTLQWVLFGLLAKNEFRKRFPATAKYFLNDDLKRIALAEKTADLFDQYQIYRPEMIRSWNADNAISQTEDWQKYLWMQARKILGDSMPDKTAIGEQIIASLRQPAQQQRLKSLIPNIHLFGLSILTAYHVHIFYELSKIINVSIHLLNPAPSMYWQEDKSEKQLSLWRQKSEFKFDPEMFAAGNPLLTSWGRVLQDTFGLFFEADELINEYNEVESTEPLPENLLTKIQNDIFNNHDRKTRNEIDVKDLSDGSITISSCYTIAREVEVLYNYLVHLLDQKNETLSARDIVVMVSDIDAYAPYIKAIFNSAHYKFPFTIADESFAISDNIFSALQSILALSVENFKAEQVLQLLESSWIRNRFGISDIELVRKAVDAANIRFGINGSRDDDTNYVSWKNGINRIMFGICMSGGEEYFIDGVSTFPLDITEGVEAFQLIRFCHFARVLISTIEERSRARTISEWCSYIEQVVDKLICLAEDNTEEDFQLLHQKLEAMNVLNEIVTDSITYDVFQQSIASTLSAESRSNAFASGGITFCSLIPMRSIPFKVVALLGLDFDKFPRKESPVSFNIILQQQRRRGDRNVKDNDKHLFLETVLSAQKYLYISYLGRSAKDNTTKPPSVLVDELMDYIQSGLHDDKTSVKETLATLHPLHGFSNKYFQQIPGLYNYLNTAKGKELKIDEENEALTTEINFDEVNIGSFISFFKNPIKAYYNQVLGIRYEQNDVLLPESEIFELHGLQEWQLKNDLLFLKEEDEDLYKHAAIAKGTLPLKNMADYYIDTVAEQVEKVKIHLDEIVGNEPASELNIELNFDGTILKGKLDQLYGDKLLFIAFSKRECKYVMEAYLRYLIATAAGACVELNYISGYKDSVFKIPAKKRSKKQALEILQRLLKLYKQGFKEILVFYPDFEKKPSEILSMDGDSFNKMLNKFLNNGCYDEYIRKAHAYGFFNDRDVYTRYLKSCQDIFSEEQDFFETYFSVK